MNDMTPVTAPSLGKLAKALAAAQAEMKPAAKDANNPHFKSKYADLEAVNEAARVLATHGIAVMCVPDGWNENRIVIRAMLVHESGEMMEGRLEVPVSQPNNPQALGSAMTYGRRYAVSALANIATSDDDGNAASEKDGTPEPKKAHPRTVPDTPSSVHQPDPKSTDKGSEGPSPASKWATAMIDAIVDAKSFGDACSLLIEKGGLIDVADDGTWNLEAGSKLSQVKAKSPEDFARIIAAYEGRKSL